MSCTSIEGNYIKQTLVKRKKYFQFDHPRHLFLHISRLFIDLPLSLISLLSQMTLKTRDLVLIKVYTLQAFSQILFGSTQMHTQFLRFTRLEEKGSRNTISTKQINNNINNNEEDLLFILNVIFKWYKQFELIKI